MFEPLRRETDQTGLELRKSFQGEALRILSAESIVTKRVALGEGPSMSDEIQVGATFHKKRVGKHIAMVEGPPPTAPERPKGRLPRITRDMALAIYYEDLIRQGRVHDYAEIAALDHVTRARVTQIMNLRLLAPDIQERLLFLIRIVGGRDVLCLRSLQPIALESDWRKQRECWNKVMSS